MIKIQYYKLPLEGGENVILLDHYVYRDSEIAITIEQADLRLPFFSISYEFEKEDAKPVAAFVPREDAEDLPEPYLTVSDEGVFALLPFKSGDEARHFAWEIAKRYNLMKVKFDA